MSLKHRTRSPPTTRNIPELGISAEKSVRQFPTTFPGLTGSNPQFEGAFLRLLRVPGLPASHRDRSEFFCHKRNSGREINMLPSSWKDLLQKGQCFGIFARFIFVQEARKDSRVVIDYHICNQATALIADLDVDIRFTGQLFLASYLSNCRSKLVIGFDAVL